MSGGIELKKFDPAATASSSFFSKKTAGIPLTFAAAHKVKRNSIAFGGQSSTYRGMGGGTSHRNKHLSTDCSKSSALLSRTMTDLAKVQ